jgi:hypothetical protein
VDLNTDGKTEVLSGSWPGEITLFERSGKNGFTRTVLNDTSGKQLSCGKATATWAADWDSDGDTDLLVGNFDGEVKLVRNVGTKKKANFEPLRRQRQMCIRDRLGSGRQKRFARRFRRG